MPAYGIDAATGVLRGHSGTYVVERHTVELARSVPLYQAEVPVDKSGIIAHHRFDIGAGRLAAPAYAVRCGVVLAEHHLARIDAHLQTIPQRFCRRLRHLGSLGGARCHGKRGKSRIYYFSHQSHSTVSVVFSSLSSSLEGPAIMVKSPGSTMGFIFLSR